MQKNKPNELYIDRIYNAPVEMVWNAWTDLEQVAQWWGPRGFTITTHSKELKPGGSWVYTMHGPDGVDYPNKTVYHVVEKNSRLVYDHGITGDNPPLFQVEVVFSAIGKKTKMEMTMRLATAEAAKEIKKFIKQAGGDSTWDRLAEYIEKTENKKETFVINRSFDANIETLFTMWTDPKHFSKWLAPKGFEMDFIRSEIKQGSQTFYCMANEAGMKMYGRAHYLKIEKPTLLVYTQEFCDENENVSRHPAVPTWPAKMLTTVIFSEESQNKTRITVTWEPCGNYTDEELATFVAMRAGMTMGWTGSFDKLEEYIGANL